jgi:hypothetical protein
MSNLTQDQSFNRNTTQTQPPQNNQFPQNLQSGQFPPQIIGKEQIIENRPAIVGHQPIIENQKVVIGQQPIMEKRNVVVGQQPIIENRPTVVGTQPIVQQKDFVVGQQPVIGEKPTIVGQRPIVQQQPAIVGERILLEQRTQQPIFDPRLHLNQQNLNQNGNIGVFRNGARIVLRSSKDRFLGSKGSRIKHSKRRKDTGIWLVESYGRDIFALKNASDGRYLSCDGSKLHFSRDRGEQELWKVEQAPHEGTQKYLLQNYRGEFLSEGLLGIKLMKDHPTYKTFWEAESV